MPTVHDTESLNRPEIEMIHFGASGAQSDSPGRSTRFDRFRGCVAALVGASTEISPRRKLQNRRLLPWLSS
jgi:hypothetical protein